MQKENEAQCAVETKTLYTLPTHIIAHLFEGVKGQYRSLSPIAQKSRLIGIITSHDSASLPALYATLLLSRISNGANMISIPDA